MDLMSSLNEVLEVRAPTRVNGRTRSQRSITAATEVLRANFRVLLQLNFKLQNVSNLSERHIKALCQDWHKRGLSPKTMQGYLSHLRIFCTWIEKKGLVKHINYYLPDVPKEELRVHSMAKESKSWAEHGIDVDEKAKEAMALDWRFGCMILIMVSFGLRKAEVLNMIPWKADLGDRLWVPIGKNGRTRDFYIKTLIQREILNFVKSKVKKNETLGWVDRMDGKPHTAKGRQAYSEVRYETLMEKIGITKALSNVTGHGLRAQFAENAALLHSFIPPTLGGTAGQMPREDLDVGRMQVSEMLGHSRVSVTGAYYGSFGKEGPLDAPGLSAQKLNACFASINDQELTPISHSRLELCMKLQNALMAIEVFCDPRKVQALWEDHSKRHATDWLDLDLEKISPLAILETAAVLFMRRKEKDIDTTD